MDTKSLAVAHILAVLCIFAALTLAVVNACAMRKVKGAPAKTAYLMQCAALLYAAFTLIPALTTWGAMAHIRIRSALLTIKELTR